MFNWLADYPELRTKALSKINYRTEIYIIKKNDIEGKTIGDLYAKSQKSLYFTADVFTDSFVSAVDIMRKAAKLNDSKICFFTTKQEDVWIIGAVSIID